MARPFPPSAVRLAALLRELNPDVKLHPVLERQLGRKQRTVDVTTAIAPPALPEAAVKCEEPR